MFNMSWLWFEKKSSTFQKCICILTRYTQLKAYLRKSHVHTTLTIFAILLNAWRWGYDDYEFTFVVRHEIDGDVIDAVYPGQVYPPGGGLFVIWCRTLSQIYVRLQHCWRHICHYLVTIGTVGRMVCWGQCSLSVHTTIKYVTSIVKYVK